MKHKITSLFTLLLLLGLSLTTNGQRFTFPSSQTIPDNAGGCGDPLELTVEVDGIGLLDYANGNRLGDIYISLDHSYMGDVIIKLTSPEGTTVTLYNQSGGGSEDMTQCFFVSWPGATPIANGSGPYTGDWAPHESFDAFDGEWADGTWTLTFCDVFTPDQGLVSWSYMRFNITNRTKYKMLHVDFDNGTGDNEGYDFALSALPVTNTYKVVDMYGQDDHAYSFSGNTLTLGTESAELNATTQLTLAAWVKPSDVSGQNGIIGKSDANYQNLYKLDILDGEFHAEVKVNGVGYHTTGGAAVVGKWSHVAVTYSTNGNMRLYVDGVQVHAVPASSSALADLNGQGNWRIGCAPWDPTWHKFEGVMDDIGVWNHILNVQGVQHHMSAHNNHCRSAVELPATGGSCSSDAYAQNFYGHNSSGFIPTCASYGGSDQWFKVTVPSSGDVMIETKQAGGQTSITDGGMEVYSGSCNAFTAIECDDDSGDGNMSKIYVSGRTPGETLYIRAWAYNNNEAGFFEICAYIPDFTAVEDEVFAYGFSVYPNPANDIVNIEVENLDANGTVLLMDMAGRLITQEPLRQGKLQLDLSNYPAGVFFIVLDVDGKTQTKKLIHN